MFRGQIEENEIKIRINFAYLIESSSLEYTGPSPLGVVTEGETDDASFWLISESREKSSLEVGFVLCCCCCPFGLIPSEVV